MIALITFLIYWFVIRKRRQQWEQEYVADFDRYSEKGTQGDRTSSQRARSIGPRHSTASTTYTRSSNVIQIAFIPGITDQEHTPPVPPIPSSQPHSPYTDASGDHYFMPGDLRDSTYSGFTDDGASTIDRRSMARSIAPSIAPSLLRESVASHVFNDTLTNPMPAQTALRGRANMVSVQRSANASRSPSVPAVPTIDRSKYPAPQQSSNALAGASGSSASRSRTELAPRSPDVPSIQVTSDSASAHTDDDGLSFRSAQPDLRGAIQEATRRASARPTHGGFGTAKPSTPGSANRDPSPFSDANRLPESSSAETTPRT